MNPMDLRRGINLAVDHVVTVLKSRAKMISTTEEIAQVGGALQLQAEECSLISLQWPLLCSHHGDTTPKCHCI